MDNDPNAPATTPPAAPPAAPEKPKKGEKPAIALVKLRHEYDTSSYPLSIGGERYDVVDGAVEVLPEHVGAAALAGFR